MKARSIIARPHEVRALLDRGEVLFVRPVKPQPAWEPKGGMSIRFHDEAWRTHIDSGRYEGFCETPWWPCPFGPPGGELIVKETWCWDGTVICYKARGDVCSEGHWRSPATMPQGASGLTVKLESVECRRAHSLTPTEALAAGLPPASLYGYDCDTAQQKWDEWAEMWDSRYARRGLGWESHCWVWMGRGRRI